MPMNAEESSRVATELLFVYTNHNLPGISEAESVDYYTPREFQRARADLKEHVGHQLDLFTQSWDYANYFADDADDSPEELISDDEVADFRAALAAEDRQTPFD